jgi:hypothetical protein
MSRPFTTWDNIRLWLGFPKIVKNGSCIKCNTGGGLIDIGDGDRICSPCWKSHVPSYEEV